MSNCPDIDSRPDVDGCDQTFEHFDDMALGRGVLTEFWDWSAAAYRWYPILNYLKIGRLLNAGRKARSDRVIFLKWLVLSYNAWWTSATPHESLAVRIIVMRDNVGGQLPIELAQATYPGYGTFPSGYSRIRRNDVTDFLNDAYYPRFTILADRVVYDRAGTDSATQYPMAILDSFRIPLGFPVSFNVDEPGAVAGSSAMGPGNLIVMGTINHGDGGSSNFVINGNIKVYFDDYAASGREVEEGHFFDTSLVYAGNPRVKNVY